MIYNMEMAIRAMNAAAGVEKVCGALDKGDARRQRIVHAGRWQMVWIACLTGYNLRYNGDIRFAMDLLHILQVRRPRCARPSLQRRSLCPRKQRSGTGLRAT